MPKSLSELESKPAHPIFSDVPKCDRIEDVFNKAHEKVSAQGCTGDAEFKVKIGMLWGHYCGEHTLDFMRSDNWNPEEQPIYPIDYEVSEESA